MMSGRLKQVLDNVQENSPIFTEIFNYPYNTADDMVNEIDSSANYRVIKSAEGKLSTVEDNNNIKDWGKNNSPFPFHLDGGYYIKVPQYVILYCVRPSPSGGNTFFSKSEDVIKLLENKYDHNLLTSINIVWISSDRKRYKRSLIENVEGGRQLNWFSSLYLEADATSISDSNRRFLTRHLTELLQDIEIYLKQCITLNHKWQEGDLLLFNNQLHLHGRDTIPSKSDRLLYRVWLDRKTFLETKNPILL